MSAAQHIAVETREQSGTGQARAVRRSGMVPGIVYGSGGQPQMIAMDPRDLVKGINRRSFYSTVLTLDIAGKESQQVLPKCVQFHPVSDAPLHIDFMRVQPGTEVTVAIPVKLLNQEKCRGLKIGGILNIVRHNVDVVCDATKIPSTFTIDIAAAKIGEAIKASRIDLPEGVRFAIQDRDFTLATIATPKGMTTAEAQEAESGGDDESEEG